MFDVLFYKDRRGREPAVDWINSPQNGNIRGSIFTRITALQQEGDNLSLDMLVPIRPRNNKEKRVQGFYELKHRGKGWRLAIYQDIQENRFVLLWGWHKSPSNQKQNIDKAYSLLYDYLARRG